MRSVLSTDLFLSTVTVGEIELGIEKRRGVDIGVARRWGRLAARLGNKGLDLAIAATALEHGLTVATRNVPHYEPTGVPILNPFESVAAGEA